MYHKNNNNNNNNIYEEACILKARAYCITRQFDNAQSDEILLREQFNALLTERSDLMHQVCILINKINDRLNEAKRNVFARLPVDEYKKPVEARKTAREAKAMLLKLGRQDY